MSHADHTVMLTVPEYEGLLAELRGWIDLAPATAARIATLEAIADARMARIEELERALYGAAESLATFRPPQHEPDDWPRWTELDEVTLHEAQQLCGKYPQSETACEHEPATVIDTTIFGAATFCRKCHKQL